MIVHVENGMFMMSKADRSAIPVMIPGSAIGSTNRSETDSRPKKRARDSAAPASVPKTSASSVAMSATFRDSQSGGHISGRSYHAAWNQRVVNPGGGN